MVIGAGKVSLQFDSSPIFGTVQKVGEDSSKSVTTKTAVTNSKSPNCPNGCQNTKIYRDGLRYSRDESITQRWLCTHCGLRFSDKPLKTEAALSNSRQICAEGAKNLVTTQTLEMFCAGDETLLNYAWLLKKKRQNSDSTIKLRVKILKSLKSKGAKLNDPESVETVLAVEPLTQSQKFEIVRCYKSYTKIMKIP